LAADHKGVKHTRREGRSSPPAPVFLAGKPKKADTDILKGDKPPHGEDDLPLTPEQNEALKDLFASLLEGSADRIKGLADVSRAFRNEVVGSLLVALDTYLATHEPQENPKIVDPIERRKDLVRQKRELAEEVAGAIERAGLTLCCPSGKPGFLR